ncbi:hypothetical protein Cfor_04396 [Coptotermes formosanus]|uniref:Centaurin-gamma-1A n=1 Tax=Coptotermes formosanus TaxID=36987 RepID=A0A6L2P9A3_COPFO|nr:hypothetical protein Cfor_04396 [Coptotermes formosanus]
MESNAGNKDGGNKVGNNVLKKVARRLKEEDAISENNPRVIDDARARKLASDLKRCSYYETCATYGLNVERVFQDACQKIVQQRLSSSTSCLTPTNSRPSTPNNHFSGVIGGAPRHHQPAPSPTNNGFLVGGAATTSSSSPHTSGGSPASNVLVGNASPSHAQTLSHKVTLYVLCFSKSRRRSNLFTPSKKGDDKLKNGELGSGRAIPIKQGYLYKRSSKALNKDWKKKYVTLCDDGRLTYHPSLHDYMDDVHGKEISLQYVTVKVPGQKPRGSKSIMGDSDGYEFFIVSLDNKQWHFEAGNSEERDEWVSAIEQQILNSLQVRMLESRISVDSGSIQTIRSRVPGNTHCADCDASNPDWASLNLGVLMCIECSGIHRNLGSHISRVRSLDLDEWPPGHLSVMLSIGNTLANSIWECNPRGRAKPTPNSSREEKERWIRSKYESKEFLAPVNQGVSVGQQLVDAVCRTDMKSIALLLAHASAEQVNSCVSVRDLRTPLHLSCAMGNLPVAQLLIWHGANLKAVDHEGRTCLAYARAAQSLALSKPSGGGNNSAVGNGELSVAATTSLVELLVANGCPEVTSGTLPRRRGPGGGQSDPAQAKLWNCAAKGKGICVCGCLEWRPFQSDEVNIIK